MTKPIRKRWLLPVALVAPLLLASTHPTLTSNAYLDSIDYSDKHVYDTMANEATTATTFATKAAPTAPAVRFAKRVSLSLSAGTTPSADTVCRVFVGLNGAGTSLVEVAPGQATQVDFDGRGLNLSTTTFAGTSPGTNFGCALAGTTLGGVRCFCAVVYSDETP